MIEVSTAIDFIEKLEDSSVQLFYFDPPFGCERKFRNKQYEFSDPTAKEVMSLIDFELIKKKMKDSGLVAVHCDYRLSHHIRMECDRVFGYKNFVNEIVWCYKTGGSTNKRLSRKHDVIIVYSKTKNFTFNPLKEISYNRDFKRYGFSFDKATEYQDQDGKWYTLVNMKDYWIDIPALGITHGDRTGYPTQKPKELSNRVISLFSNEGDVVCDLFCGSGTHLVSAKQLNRVPFGCDISEDAVELTKGRIKNG